MDTLHLILGIILLACGVFVVVAVLMQHGKSHGLSGAIAGGAETFFGKEKGKQWDRVLSRVTTIVGALFVVAVLALYVFIPDGSFKTATTSDGREVSISYSTKADTVTTVD